METTQDNQQPKITLNLDEFDIESFDIKPVTKGLGFHNNSSPGVKPRVAAVTRKSQPIANPLGTSSHRAAGSKQSPAFLQSTPQTVTDPALLSGIDALYGSQHGSQHGIQHKSETGSTLPQSSIKESQKINKSKKIKEAEMGEQGFAFMLDLSLIIGITTLLFTSFFIFAFKRFNGEMMISFLRDSIPFIAVLASLIYLTYFSLLEPVGTVGKKLLGLGTFIVGTNKRSNIRTSFSRALVSLLSLPLIGIPLVLDFHGKLSDTVVLKLK